MHMLTNPWLHYAWGSVDLLPALLHMRSDSRPVAEIWMGAHPALPSSIEVDGHEVDLDEFVEHHAQQALGAGIVSRSGAHLPYMMKLLAAGQPLSLKVHPTREQAERGYDREDAAGIPLSDPTRNFRDRSHKPEMLYALTPFEMMCGFRPVDVIWDLLAGLGVAELAPFIESLDRADPSEALRLALTALLTGETREQQVVTRAVVASACARSTQRPEYRLVQDLSEHFPNDIGIVASLFLNYVRIAPGDSVFIGAGLLHSHIRGLALELTVTSDNALRAGLTSKHVDVPELLDLVSFTSQAPAQPPAVHLGDASIFLPPVADFALWTYRPASDADFGTLVTLHGPSVGARIAVCCAGHCTLTCHGERLVLTPGQSAFVSDADGPIEISTTGTVAIAYVP